MLLTDNLPLKALQNDSSADAQALSLPSFLPNLKNASSKVTKRCCSFTFLQYRSDQMSKALFVRFSVALMKEIIWWAIGLQNNRV